MLTPNERPQPACRSLQHGLIHRKRQTRPARLAARHECNRAQRVVEVCWVHLRALLRRARTQLPFAGLIFFFTLSYFARSGNLSRFVRFNIQQATV